MIMTSPSLQVYRKVVNAVAITMIDKRTVYVLTILWPLHLAHIFSSHCHFNPCHSSSSHSFMPVSVNKPSSVTDRLYAGSLKSSHSASFILFILF